MSVDEVEALATAGATAAGMSARDAQWLVTSPATELTLDGGVKLAMMGHVIAARCAPALPPAPAPPSRPLPATPRPSRASVTVNARGGPWARARAGTTSRRGSTRGWHARGCRPPRLPLSTTTPTTPSACLRTSLRGSASMRQRTARPPPRSRAAPLHRHRSAVLCGTPLRRARRRRASIRRRARCSLPSAAVRSDYRGSKMCCTLAPGC